jgi:hypothetical protein
MGRWGGNQALLPVQASQAAGRVQPGPPQAIRRGQCKACFVRRKSERYRREPAFRARCVEQGAEYRKTERGSLVTKRAQLRV